MGTAKCIDISGHEKWEWEWEWELGTGLGTGNCDRGIVIYLWQIPASQTYFTYDVSDISRTERDGRERNGLEWDVTGRVGQGRTETE